MKSLFALLALTLVLAGCIVAPGPGYGHRGYVERGQTYREAPAFRPGPGEYRRYDR